MMPGRYAGPTYGVNREIFIDTRGSLRVASARADECPRPRPRFWHWAPAEHRAATARRSRLSGRHHDRRGPGLLTRAHIRPALLALALLPSIAAARLLGGREFRVNTTTAGDQYISGVARQGAAGTIVTWYNSGPGTVFAQRYDADGLPIGSEIDVSPGYQDLAAAASGNFVTMIVGLSPVMRFFDASGVPFGPAFSPVAGFTSGADIAKVGAGYVFVWSAQSDGAGYGIFARRYDDAGNALGSTISVNSSTADDQFAPVVAGDAAGNFTVVWDTYPGVYPGWNLVARSFDASNTPLGPDYTVAPYGPSHGIGSNDAGMVAIVWDDANHLVGRLYGAGTPVTAAFDVSNDPADNSFGPQAAVDAAGNVFFVWERFSGAVRGRFHESSGAPLTPAFDLSSYAPGFAQSPYAAAGANGSFFVAWSQVPNGGRGRDGDGSGIFARRFAHEIGIGGRQVLIRDDPDMTKRKIRFIANDTVVSTSPAAGVDPVTDGAYLHVHGNGATTDSACMALPAGGWTASGDPAAPTYDYRDPDYVNGPCGRVRVRSRVITATCRASAMPITYSLDEPAQGAVGVQFVSGASLYCAALGGTVVKDTQNSQFRARGAAPPSICPTPPASCP